MNATKKVVYFILFAAVAVVLVYGPSYFKKKDLPKLTIAPNLLPDSGGKPIFLMFYSDSCSICQEMKPIISQLQAEYGNKVFFHLVDSQNSASFPLVEAFQVQGLPSFFWLTPDLKIFDANVGRVPDEEMLRITGELSKKFGST
ncbi:MAG TPA: thioredoxin domain-containing protein [bacterium]|nr:thioredoxin domain-containing protein [bacterium]